MNKKYNNDKQIGAHVYVSAYGDIAYIGQRAHEPLDKGPNRPP